MPWINLPKSKLIATLWQVAGFNNLDNKTVYFEVTSATGSDFTDSSVYGTASSGSAGLYQLVKTTVINPSAPKNISLTARFISNSNVNGTNSSLYTVTLPTVTTAITVSPTVIANGSYNSLSGTIYKTVANPMLYLSGTISGSSWCDSAGNTFATSYSATQSPWSGSGGASGATTNSNPWVYSLLGAGSGKTFSMQIYGNQTDAINKTNALASTSLTSSAATPSASIGVSISSGAIQGNITSVAQYPIARTMNIEYSADGGTSWKSCSSISIPANATSTSLTTVKAGPAATGTYSVALRGSASGMATVTSGTTSGSISFDSTSMTVGMTITGGRTLGSTITIDCIISTTSFPGPRTFSILYTWSGQPWTNGGYTVTLPANSTTVSKTIYGPLTTTSGPITGFKLQAQLTGMTTTDGPVDSGSLYL